MFNENTNIKIQDYHITIQTQSWRHIASNKTWLNYIMSSLVKILYWNW